MTAAIELPSKPRPREELRNNILMAVTCLVLIGLGWLLMVSVTSRVTTFTAPNGALIVDYPASWVTAAPADPGILLEAYDIKALSGYHPTLRIHSNPAIQGQTLFDAATSQSMQRNRSLREYTEMSSQSVTLAGQPAIVVSYGYVADPSAGSGQAALPSLVRAADVLVLHGGNLLVFTMEGDANSISRYQSTFDRILRSTRLN